MNILMMQGVFADQAAMIAQALSIGWTEYFLFLAYMIIGSLTMLNMLIGAICDVVGSVAEVNKEEVMLQNVHYQITSMVHEINDDNDVLISREEFKQLVAPLLPHPFHRSREPPLCSPGSSAGPPLPKAGAGSSNCVRSSRLQV